MRSSDVEKARGTVSAFVVDEKRMNRNAGNAGNSVAWETTKLHTPLGGRGNFDPFREATEQVRRNQRSVAFDVAQDVRRDRLHQALDRLIAEDEDDAEPAEEDEDEDEQVAKAAVERAEYLAEEEAGFSMDELQGELNTIAASDDEPRRSTGKDSEAVDTFVVGDKSMRRKICCFDCSQIVPKQAAHAHRVV